MRTVEERLRINGRSRAGNIFEMTAIFARDPHAVACLVNEKISFSVRTAAMNIVFFGKVAEDVAYFAKKEGLGAHARSATIRFEDKK